MLKVKNIGSQLYQYAKQTLQQISHFNCFSISKHVEVEHEDSQFQIADSVSVQKVNDIHVHQELVKKKKKKKKKEKKKRTRH